MSHIPPVDSILVSSSMDEEILVYCPEPECPHAWKNLGVAPVPFGQVKEAATQLRFEHLMESGQVGSGTER
jgi:hypothetical protein